MLDAAVIFALASALALQLLAVAIERKAREVGHA